MSGINSLIDTVLHQVLGKRVDTAPPRELNEPVRPISPSDAPRALHSDSRLDARARSSLVVETHRPAREGVSQTSGQRAAANSSPPASTQTHFTPAARSIADVLLRFPAPASTMRLEGPLLGALEPSSPALVAERLQGSVRDSGLFYESHLARWYRGEMPRDQLLREPQGLRFTPPVPPPSSIASRGAAAGRAGQGAAPPAGQPMGGEVPSLRSFNFSPAPPALEREWLSPAKTFASAELPERAPPLAARETSLPPAREPVQESLQGIVRQQLEMLVTPVLRWEGDVWTGLFMALVLQVPVSERGESGPEEQAGGDDEADAWRSTMTLEVAEFGEVQVSLWMKGGRLDLGLAAPEPRVHEVLESGLDRLEQRLAALDLDEVRVHLSRESGHE